MNIAAMPTAASVHSAPNPLVANNITALERALAVIKRLPEAVFTDKSEASFSASVGEHFRHIIEHYREFLNGWPNGLVDYDARPRNAQLENDPANALAAFQDLRRSLRALPADLDLDQPLMVRCCTEAAGDAPVPSCVSRELVFLHSHSVHHFALIAFILKHRGITMDEDFGIAPSTLVNRRERDRPRNGKPGPSPLYAENHASNAPAK